MTHRESPHGKPQRKNSIGSGIPAFDFKDRKGGMEDEFIVKYGKEDGVACGRFYAGNRACFGNLKRDFMACDRAGRLGWNDILHRAWRETCKVGRAKFERESEERFGWSDSRLYVNFRFNRGAENSVADFAKLGAIAN